MCLGNTLPLKQAGKLMNLNPERSGATKSCTITPNMCLAYSCNGPMHGVQVRGGVPPKCLSHIFKFVVIQTKFVIIQTKKFVCNIKNFVWIMTNFVCRSMEPSTATNGSR